MEEKDKELRQLCLDVHDLKLQLDRWQERQIRQITDSMAELDGIIMACDSALYRAAQIYDPPYREKEGEKIDDPPDRE